MQCWRPGFHPWVGKVPWRGEWQPTPAFLPGGFHGQRSLVGCSPWGLRVSENQISVILPQSDQVGVSGRSAQVLSKSFSTWACLAFGARRFFAVGMSCALQNGLVSFPGLAPLDTHIIPSPSYANQKCSQTVQSPLGN